MTSDTEGDYWVTVQAVDGNNVHSNRSERSATVTIGAGANNQQHNEDNQSSIASSDIPANVQGAQTGDNSARWNWTGVQGAASYIVYLDGNGQNPIQTNGEYLVIGNLSDGDHSIKVAAVNSSTGQHSDQSAASVVTITSDFSNTGDGNNNVAPPPPADDNGLIDPASWNYLEATQKEGYELVFSDEFNTNTLNPARWNTQLRWDGSYNGERYEYRLINEESQFYSNIYSQDQDHLDKIASIYNPFEFDGQRLAIRAKRNPLKDRDTKNAYGPLDTISRQQPFLSGAISTYDKFSQKYGYFEARIKIPSHIGTFPAFWLHHQRSESEGTQRTEIDIMENLGHRSDYVYNSFHYYTGVSEGVTGEPDPIKPYPQGQIFTGIDYSNDYHIYAVEWSPGYISFQIDGQHVSEVRPDMLKESGAIDHEELYVILNLAVGGKWTNYGTDAGGTGRGEGVNRFPTQQDINEWGNPALEIDYVRVFKAL